MRTVRYLFTPDRVMMSVERNGVVVEPEHDVSYRFEQRGTKCTSWRPALEPSDNDPCLVCGHSNHGDEPACGWPDPQFGFCPCPVNAV